jgi:uncharacterized sulfatase
MKYCVFSLLVALLASISPGKSAAQNIPRPNILLYISDDHGIDYVGCYGNTAVRTPNIDALARQGMKFTRVFAASPTCSPSRCAMFTGLYPQRNGTMGNHTDCFPGIESLPRWLRKAGYRVVAAAKTDTRPRAVFDWELLPAKLPTDAKFRRYREEGPDLAKVDAFLKAHTHEHPNQPLCLIIGDSSPHVVWETNRIFDPATLPMNPLLVDTPITRRALANYYQDIDTMDKRLGETMEMIDRHGLSTNTVFIYTTDQGAEWPRCKWTLYDSGLRVPFIVRWPGVTKPASVCDALMSLVDLAPTLASIGGGQAPAGIDGVSFVEILRGRETSCREDLFATHTGDGMMNLFPQRAIRDARYKYILNLHPDRPWTTHFTKVQGIPDSHAAVWQTWVEKASQDPAAAKLVDAIVHHPAEELFDTQTDPHELTNLLSRAEMRPVAERLRQRLGQMRKQLRDQED